MSEIVDLMSRWLESLRHRIGDLSLFSSVAGTRRICTEQGQQSREGVGGTECCVVPIRQRV
jgi:hypothetical protein